MVTPFHDDGSLDVDGAVLARWLVDHGNDGLVVAGTTGEAPTLTDDERWSWGPLSGLPPTYRWSPAPAPRQPSRLRAQRSGRRHRRRRAARRHPLLQPPVEEGLEAHFRAVAAATGLPVVMYDIPGRTARKVPTELLVRLANEVPTIVGIKDAAGNPGETARVIPDGPRRLSVWSGDDPMTFRCWRSAPSV